MKAKDKSVTGLTRGVEGLFKKNGVTYIKGHGRFIGLNEIKVDGLDGSENTFRAKNFIIATGSESTPLKGLDVCNQIISYIELYLYIK
jgi:dihydrolipoamide dehydrogenase